MVGCTGLVSLGHGAFYGLAAYVVYSDHASRSGIANLDDAADGGACSWPRGTHRWCTLARTKGFFFLMVTLAFGQMIFFLFHDTKLGGGTDGVYLAKPLLSVFGLEWNLGRRDRPVVIFYVALIQLVAMYLLLVVLLKSLFGRVLDGVRVNEARMLAIGYNTYRYKLAAFVVAGLLAGMAGHMWALHRGFVSPELAGWHRSAEALLMILFGGIGTLHGPILGALGLTALSEIAQQVTERKLLVEGVVILIVVFLLPQGLSGFRIGGPRLPDPDVNRQHGVEDGIFSVTSEAGATMTSARGTSPPLLATERLSRSFGGLIAVREVSIALHPGELHAVIGPNGAGKSTLVNLFAGELSPTAGRVMLSGMDVSHEPVWRRTHLGDRTFIPAHQHFRDHDGARKRATCRRRRCDCRCGDC